MHHRPPRNRTGWMTWSRGAQRCRATLSAPWRWRSWGASCGPSLGPPATAVRDPVPARPVVHRTGRDTQLVADAGELHEVAETPQGDTAATAHLRRFRPHRLL